jgi:hypothetical protein
MYGSGTSVLFENLPELEGLTPDSARRVLSSVYGEILAQRLSAEVVTVDDATERHSYLRRLAAALESYAVFDRAEDDDEDVAASRAGAAFIAAEALSLAADLFAIQPERPYRYRLAHPAYLARVEAGLLYLIAGFDANATPCARAVPARPVDTRSLDGRFAEWACDAFRLLLFLRPQPRPAPRSASEAETVGDIEVVARAVLFEELGDCVTDYIAWLGVGEGSPSETADRLRQLADLLVAQRGAQHADIHHLARLLETAIRSTSPRALRAVPVPDGMANVTYLDYITARARGDDRMWPRPLLWPPARDFVSAYIRDAAHHVVVNAPTGSGKSAIAEIALTHALSQGWAVYLVPTNALANQVRADLAESLAPLEGVQVRAFVGDAEYSLLEDESVAADEADAGTVVVMTPEKCALALRLRPQLFENCGLCVFDECHLLRDGARGALAELVVGHVLAVAPECRIVLMSAMVANPDDLAAWLNEATGRTAAVVREPWRPTRTMRSVVGLDADPVREAAVAAFERLADRSTHFRFEKFPARHALLLGLCGPWSSGEAEDYALLRLPTATTLKVSRERTIQSSDWTNPTTAVVAEHLARSGFSTLAFTPADPHHAFSVAGRIDVVDVPREPIGERTQAYLVLAEDELGVTSRVRSNIENGVAVHTAALVDAERLASERAFREGSALVMAATGTVAQGLNFPATAVVVAGTVVGDRRDAATEEGRVRAQSQLLNALGRAGRAGVANQGLSIVVPEQLVLLSGPADNASLRNAVAFIASDDASTDVRSALGPLVERATEGRLDVGSATPEELVAYSYLPFQEQDGVSATDILARTLAVTRAPAGRDVTAAVVADSVLETGFAYLESTQAPEWLTGATYRTGLPFFQALRFQQARARLLQGGGEQAGNPPSSILGWIDHLFGVLRLVPPDTARAMLGRKLSAPRMAPLWADDAVGDDPLWEPHEEWLGAWGAVQDAVRLFISGQSLAAIAQEVLGAGRDVDPERTGGGKPLPRLIAFTNSTVERLSRFAGLVVACEELDPQLLPIEAIRDEGNSSWHSLALLPLALRCGCDSESSLSWFRFGLRLRRPAHRLARLFPLAAGIVGDAAAREWIGARLAEWLADDDGGRRDDVLTAIKLLVS